MVNYFTHNIALKVRSLLRLFYMSCKCNRIVYYIYFYKLNYNFVYIYFFSNKIYDIMELYSTFNRWNVGSIPIKFDAFFNKNLNIFLLII